MEFDSLYYPHPSRRMVVYAKNGVVAASQPLAAQAGLEVMQRGGNAVDAAVAAAAVLTVTEPTSNGIGGDAFAIVCHRGKLYGLNSSGYSPAGLSYQVLKKAGFSDIPEYGWETVTVPGAPAAWAELWRRFGAASFNELFKRAVAYAEEGVPVSPTVGSGWAASFDKYRKVLHGDIFKHWFNVFAPDGKVPRIGSLWKSPLHARTLKFIAETEAESFYRGELAEKIIDFSNSTGGYFSGDDFAGFRPLWVDTISVNYKGYDIHEIPPNGQGIVALMALNMLADDDLNGLESGEAAHISIEAIKNAFADAAEYVADPDYMKLDYNSLISNEYGKLMRRDISGTAANPFPGKPKAGGTVYLAAADSDGTMVSYIQSNYMGFGSGLVVPGTGIALHNRGKNFVMKPQHPNCIGPGKRPYHTIIPGFITKDGKPVGPFGVMGGFMQPQGHLQVLTNMIDLHLNPQSALDAPRWQWAGGKRVLVEEGFNPHTKDALKKRGHEVKISCNKGSFGRGQIIIRDDNGVYCAGTEKRCDTGIASY